MADVLGALSFISLSGDLTEAGTLLQDISDPGRNGNAFKKMSSKAQETELTGVVDLTSSAAAKSYLATLAALEGTVVSITIRGQAHTDYLVLRATITSRRYVETPVGGVNGGNWLTRSSFTVIKVGT